MTGGGGKKKKKTNILQMINIITSEEIGLVGHSWKSAYFLESDEKIDTTLMFVR